jgi:hypothetical protein
LDSDTFSATAHVDDPAMMTNILNRVPYLGAIEEEGKVAGVNLAAGNAYPWATGEDSFGTGMTSAGDYHFLQLMFEGVRPGLGKLVFEVMHNDTVLSSSDIEIRLRPTKEFYDHYSVATDPAKVDLTNGTYRNDIDPLDDPAPVATTAALVSQNQERQRFQKQSDQYFMFVHGWRMQEWERVAFAETTFKRMYWSGFKGQFGMFDWPTQWVDQPSADPGNFDRSEFLAWNSARGLRAALRSLSAEALPVGGRLAVMAHSMGNVVLSEALYQHGLTSNTMLIDRAFLSQAAISSDYFSTTSTALPLIYKSSENGRIAERVLTRSLPGGTWHEYRGFNPYNQELEGIGGRKPRFRYSNLSAAKIFNYFNRADYALATWKLGQALKPAMNENPVGVSLVHSGIDYTGVPISADASALWAAVTGNELPGFGGTTYFYDPDSNKFVRTYTAEEGPDVSLSFARNKYEMFAFAASSVVSPLGALPPTAIGGLTSFLTNGLDLAELENGVRFNNQNTGHSAQFVHDFNSVRLYWSALLEDME